MDNLVCIDCWRRDNLTFAQRLDPAYITPGPVYRCPTHRALHDDPRGDIGPEPQAA
ncbi:MULTISPECIES: hypothetical protein [Nocardia]|uniref:Uncharacterized protein n=1 Tax=Nocardia arthritidis TaxID=228602 RepID=A0A6G9YG79_9NOCA|nr:MULTISPECIES: hypothetical protein [Nocardia]QIS12140.1 hypothetical protein F5544_21385 [Nocardia arthritidis]